MNLKTDKELYSLYLACFPNYPVSEKTFFDSIRPDQANIIYKRDGDKLIGYSVIHENSIVMLCVDSEHRGRGIGSELLSMSEKQIKALKSPKILLGRGRHYLLQGVPVDVDSCAADFFKKRGYASDFTSVNMELGLEKFSYEKLDIPKQPSDVAFRFAGPSDMPSLLEAVEDAQKSWTDIFAECESPIYIAYRDGKVVGFEIVSPDGGKFKRDGDKLGSIGCVGVVHAARNLGIGCQIVAKGANWLQKQGCRAIELGYVALVDWYAALGFEVIHRQWMGEKTLD